MSEKTYQEIMAHVFAALAGGDVSTVAGLPENDPMKRVGALIEELMSAMLIELRSNASHELVRRLMALTWELFTHKIILPALGAEVPTLHLSVYVADGQPHAMMLIPMDWHQMVQRNPQEQFGALVFVASQCADFYHGKIKTDENRGQIIFRAKAYEAQYLLGVPPAELKLTSYQKVLLREFPKGLESLPANAGGYVPGPFVERT